MLIELHTLTSHSPSNLNRDGEGRPKTALFGGRERARISSQAMKYALRNADLIKDRYKELLSKRSRLHPQQLFEALQAEYEGEPDKQDRLRRAAALIAHTIGKLSGADEAEPSEDDQDADASEPNERDDADAMPAIQTSQIVPLSQGELLRLKKGLRDLVEKDVAFEDISNLDLETLELPSNKRRKQKVISELIERFQLDQLPTDALDLMLFGRMTTSEGGNFKEVDASLQVAHAISTHEAISEPDYFTAVDDVVKEQGGRGSAHLNELDFNSAVYYKYFSCNFDLLAHNLNDRKSARDALEAFLDAACRIAPSGKQNSFASHSMASAALLVIRKAKTPCSLAEAFERPVPASEGGYLAKSLQRLATHYCTLVRDYSFNDRALLYYRVDMDDQPLVKPLARARRNGEAAAEALLPTVCFEEAGTLRDLWDFLRQHVSVDTPASAEESNE